MTGSNHTPEPEAIRAMRRRAASRHPVNRAFADEAPLGARVADRVTGFLGSWRFIAIQTVIVAIWIAGNIVLLFDFDPFPFILLNLAFSTQAAYAAPLILLAGNRQSLRDRMTLEHAAHEADIEEGQNLQLLDGNTALRGVVLDHFRMMASVARTAALDGKPIILDPAVRPPDALRLRTVVIAYPLTCEGRTITPRGVDLISNQGQQAPRQGEHVTGDALTQLVTGLSVPSGSLAATFGLQAPRQNDTVKITYAEPCQGTAEVVLPLRQTPLRFVNTPEPAIPEGSTMPAGSVRLQAQVDLEGKLHYPTYVGGPREWLQPAIQALRDWIAEPARINNAPMSTPVAVQVRFRAREDR